MKQCSRCKKILADNLFNKNKKRRDEMSYYCKECNRLLAKEYNSRPDVKKRRKEERQNPEFKKRTKEYMKNYRIDYNSRPEVKKRKREKQREYRQRPYVKEKERKQALEYNNRPDVKERVRKQRQEPAFKEYRKGYYNEWLQRSDVKERLKKYQKDYYQNPEVKTRIKEYIKDNPTKVKKWNAKHTAQRKQLGTTIIMDNPFPDDVEVDFHHFNNLLMIPMPRVVHRFVTGSTRDINKHRGYNDEWIQRLYMMDVATLFSC